MLSVEWTNSALPPPSTLQAASHNNLHTNVCGNLTRPGLLAITLKRAV